jgi:acid phosphatase
VAVAAVGASCRSAAPVAAPAAPAVERLHGLLWFQTAAEASLLQRQAFTAARAALDAALADPAWSALGQSEGARELPPAVIADIDETLLDNSPHEAWMVRAGRRFNSAEWQAWVEARQAIAIPGAAEFARYAAERGVTVFYVSNRDAPMEAATRDNLARAGFPLPAAPDVVLLRGERPEWASEKESRRREVAAAYRVLLLLGDDLADFLAGMRDAPLAVRAEAASAHEADFGRHWFVLPNPLYGSWESALDAGAPRPADDAERLARRLALLRACR